jgi:hypothetical protein
MTKHLLAGVAAFGLLSGVASAQTHPPTPPPIPAPPSVGIPGSTTTTHDGCADMIAAKTSVCP